MSIDQTWGVRHAMTMSRQDNMDCLEGRVAEFDIFNRYIGRRMPFRNRGECFSFLRCELLPFLSKDELLKADRRTVTGSLAHRDAVSEQVIHCDLMSKAHGSDMCFGCKH